MGYLWDILWYDCNATVLVVLVVQNCIALGCNVGVVIVVCKAARAVRQGQGGYDGVAGRSVRKLGLALL